MKAPDIAAIREKVKRAMGFPMHDVQNSLIMVDVPALCDALALTDYRTAIAAVSAAQNEADELRRKLERAKESVLNGYYLDEPDRNHIESVMKRLYTEQRMTGDEMRDAANLLYAVLSRL